MNELIVSNQEFDSLYQSKSIYIPGNFVSIELIKKILDDETYFDYTKRFFNNEIDKFMVVNEDKKYCFSYKRKEIIDVINIYILKNNIDDSKIIDKYNYLCSLISYDKFKNKYDNHTINITVDNNNYVVNTNDIIKLLDLPNDKFREILGNDEINGIKKEHYVYIIKSFIINNHVLDNYIVEYDNYANTRDIVNDYVDVLSINTFLSTEDTLYQKVKLDQELENMILNDIPSDFNLLEKSFYVYIMLCILLSYNEEFHAMNGNINDKFNNYLDVEKINIKNNNVLCYQFNLIYSVLLHKLGINFKSEYLTDKENYGDGHVKMNYRADKFIVVSDSTENLLEGDMVNAKIGEIVTGIRPLNKNQDTINEFKNSLNKVFNYVKNKYNLDRIKYYDKTVLSIKERLDVIIDELNKRKLTGVDAMGYLLRLRKTFYTEEERYFGIIINVIANTNTNDSRLARLSAIIRVRDNYLESNQLKYYLYTPGEKLKELSFKEIKEKFKTGEFSYLETDTNLIPEINRNKKAYNQ